MEKYGLVLAGGGAKGAYQLGAWKAMREMGIEFSAVAGVSIGAINGALIAADDYDAADRMWHCVSIDKGVKITSELREPDNLFSPRNFTVLMKEILRNGGIDASPTKDFLSEYINEEAVRNSPVKFGMVTFLLSDFTPLEIFTSDIPHGQLIDHLLASAKVPGVNKIGPEGEHFLDGGIYDNAPIGLLRKNGYDKLIVIDISSMKGVGHRQAFSCAQMIYIRPYDVDELGAAFDFDVETIEKRILAGYLDARKAFGHYSGMAFYFEGKTFREMVEEFGAKACEELEELAIELAMPRLVIYTKDEFLTTLKRLSEEKINADTADAEDDRLYETILKRIPIFKSRKEYPEAMAVLDSIII